MLLLLVFSFPEIFNNRLDDGDDDDDDDDDDDNELFLLYN